MSSLRLHRSQYLGLAITAMWLNVGMTAAPQPGPLYADPTHADLSGMWVSVGGFYFAPDRSVPKLLGEYKSTYARRTEAFKAGVAIDDVTADCLPAGMPHLLSVPYPFELMQTPGRVTFLYEYDSVVRRVPTDGSVTKPDPDNVTYHGDSFGRWEGDTLVIDTVNVRDDTQLDFTGIPHSDALRIRERWHRKDAKTLENTITLTDPKAYAEPFIVTRTYELKPKWKIAEYICEENNRNGRDEQGRTSGGALPQK
ncbi:MAG: hypothetical protein ABI645_08385 [Pseudomonadota bacterium]